MSSLPLPSEVIPHRGPAVLIDEILAHTRDETTCSAHIGESMQYVADGKADAALALEVMAQTVAAHVGLEGKWSGDGPRAGYVVGIPRMKFHGGDYLTGTRLKITVRVVFHEGPVGRFEGEVYDGETLRAEGALTVFEPPLADEATESEEAQHDG